MAEAEKPEVEKVSPCARSLAYLRKQGYLVGIVERFIPYRNIRMDLFGFVDIIALGPSTNLLIQTTTSAHSAERAKKIRGLETAQKLRDWGWVIQVHGWRKCKGKWILKEVNPF